MLWGIFTGRDPPAVKTCNFSALGALCMAQTTLHWVSMPVGGANTVWGTLPHVCEWDSKVHRENSSCSHDM